MDYELDEVLAQFIQYRCDNKINCKLILLHYHTYLSLHLTKLLKNVGPNIPYGCEKIDPWEDYFYVVQEFFESTAKKKNVKKTGQYLEVYAYCTTSPISFKFDM